MADSRSEAGNVQDDPGASLPAESEEIINDSSAVSEDSLANLQGSRWSKWDNFEYPSVGELLQQAKAKKEKKRNYLQRIEAQQIC